MKQTIKVKVEVPDSILKSASIMKAFKEGLEHFSVTVIHAADEWNRIMQVVAEMESFGTLNPEEGKMPPVDQIIDTQPKNKMNDIDRDPDYLKALNASLEIWDKRAVMNDDEIIKQRLGFEHCPVCIYRGVKHGFECLKLSPKCFLRDEDICANEYYQINSAWKVKDYPLFRAYSRKLANRIRRERDRVAAIQAELPTKIQNEVSKDKYAVGDVVTLQGSGSLPSGEYMVLEGLRFLKKGDISISNTCAIRIMDDEIVSGIIVAPMPSTGYYDFMVEGIKCRVYEDVKGRICVFIDGRHSVFVWSHNGTFFADVIIDAVNDRLKAKRGYGILPVPYAMSKGVYTAPEV